MCGILCQILVGGPYPICDYITHSALVQYHRGPDACGIWHSKSCVMVHNRLSIIKPKSGQQPIIRGKTALCVNGEIYNHLQLREDTTDFLSDCDIILELYAKYKSPKEWLNQLRGMFAFVLHNSTSKNPRKHNFIVARDPIGIIPLYYGYIDKYNMIFASEIKALRDVGCSNVFEFPPGYFLTKGGLTRYFNYDAWNFPKFSTTNELRSMLEDVVISHMMSDVPYGVLLSGGLDSSIIASMVVKNSDEPIHTFSIGMADSPDLENARIVANYLKTIHHEIVFTLEQAIAVLPYVIYYIETFDTTTVRASVPMFMLSQYIKSLGIKMVLSGEGSDELFGGYLYFSKAPNSKELQKELVRKVKLLSKYDCLRANKAMMSHSIECRVPFLDTRFVNYVLSINPEEKMSGDRMEKYILRKAFEDDLPSQVVWRQKEQFSDGVGYGWIDGIKKYSANLGLTESELYKSIFYSMYPTSYSRVINDVPSIACSTPEALQWDTSFASNPDPSGRSISNHCSK